MHLKVLETQSLCMSKDTFTLYVLVCTILVCSYVCASVQVMLFYERHGSIMLLMGMCEGYVVP